MEGIIFLQSTGKAKAAAPLSILRDVTLADMGQNTIKL